MIETRTGGDMVTPAEPVTLPEVALMLVAPRKTPVTIPALTEATVGVDDVHVAEAVRSCMLPSV